MTCLGWITAAFLAGVICMYLFRNVTGKLRRRVENVSSFSGMTYDEVLGLMRSPPYLVERRGDGTVLRIWRDGRYSIALLFDEKGICIGVDEEKD